MINPVTQNARVTFSHFQPKLVLQGLAKSLPLELHTVRYTPGLPANIRQGRKQGTLTEGEGSVHLTSSLR